MKNLVTVTLTLLICLFFQQQIAAQVRTKIYANGVPETSNAKNSERNEILVPTPADFEKLKQSSGESSSSTEYKNKFAEVVNVNYDLLQVAKLTYNGNNVVFSLKIIAKGALNISLQFSEFELSANSILSISTDYEITDSITRKENNTKGIWATRIYQGSFVYLNLTVPKDEIGKNLLRINKVGFGFQQIGGEFFGNPGASATCNINVLCPEGSGWENERNSVALIVSGGEASCTGSLVMNTCGTNVPYLLTANHCLNSDVSNWVFQFQFWSNNCSTNSGWREDIQFNGCQLKANSVATDFALVQLNQIPPANSGITYAGWTRSSAPAIQSAGIHHPKGDLMKISLSNSQAVSVPWLSGVSNHWRVSFFRGIVQPGSSGSPLFDQNRRIVGQLHGNQNNVCQNPGTNNCWCRTQIPSIGEYGRFDFSWSGNLTSSSRLSNWLDPNNTGFISTNTTAITNLISVRPEDYPISGLSQFCTSGNYSIPNLPVGATLQWTVTSIYGQQTHSVTNNILTLNRVSDGSATVSARISFCGSTIQVPSKIVQVGGTVISVTSTQTSCEGVQYNVLGAGPGANYNWSSNGNTILFNGTSTTATTSVGQIDATISGYDIAIVNTTNTCGQSVNAGGRHNPYEREIQGIYPEYTNGDHVSVSVNTTFYDTYYRWYINNTLVKEGSSATSYCTCNYETPDARVCGENTIRVEVETSCSINASYDVGFFKICNNYKSEPNVEIFPNPAKDQITVRLKPIISKQLPGNLKEIRELKIIDKLGRVKKVIRYPAKMKTIIVDVSSLKLDIYYIEVFDGTNYARLPLSILK